jgi:putative addiction module antidote
MVHSARFQRTSKGRFSRVNCRFVGCCYNYRCYIGSMVLELKLRRVGNSVGLVLPREALARLNAEEGDAVFLSEATDGGFRLTASNPEFARKMHAAESLSRRYRNALKELAK